MSLWISFYMSAPDFLLRLHVSIRTFLCSLINSSVNHFTSRKERRCIHFVKETIRLQHYRLMLHVLCLPILSCLFCVHFYSSPSLHFCRSQSLLRVPKVFAKSLQRWLNFLMSSVFFLQRILTYRKRHTCWERLELNPHDLEIVKYDQVSD